MDYYTFTDPKGMEGWVGLAITLPT